MNTLDSGWALVIGACIALGGSVLAPWIRDVTERRSARRRADRAEQRDALLSFQSSIIAFIKMRLHSAAVPDLASALESVHLDLARLQMSVSRTDAPIGNIANDLVKRTARIESQFDDASQGAFRDVTARWYRGELSARRAADLYLEKIAQRAEENGE